MGRKLTNRYAKSKMRLNWIICTAGGAWLWISLASPALAQQSTPMKPAPQEEVLLPPVAAFGQAAANKGITFMGTYIGQFASNVSGGEHEGGKAYNYQVYGGVNIDLGKLAGLQGGSILAVMSERSGYALAYKSINNSVGPQGQWGGNQTYHLMILTYKQKLFSDALEVTAGRMSSNLSILPQDKTGTYFMSNADSGGPCYYQYNSNITSTMIPSWMTSVSVRVAHDLRLTEWVTDSIPEQQRPQHHGFDFSFAKSVGAIAVTRLDYKTTFADDEYPRDYGVGLVMDRTPYSYIEYNARSHGLGSGNGYGRYDLYAYGMQAVYKPDPNTHRNLSVYGQFMYGPNAKQTALFQAVAGLVYQGPFASRPLDRVDFMVSDVHYRTRYIDQLYAYRVNGLGGTQRPAQNMIMGELNYDFYPTPWFDIMPNFQYIINTDGLGFGLKNYPKKNLPNTYIIGLQFQVNWPAVLGLSKFN